MPRDQGLYLTYSWLCPSANECTRHPDIMEGRSGGKEADERDRRGETNDNFFVILPQ